MITIQGKGVSAGVGVGPLYFYRRATAEIKRYTVEDTDAEWHRFKGTSRPARSSNWAFWPSRPARKHDEAAMLFETHQMMAEDLDYEEAIEDRILNQKMNAEPPSLTQPSSLPRCSPRWTTPIWRPAPPTSRTSASASSASCAASCRAVLRPMCRCCSAPTTWPPPRRIQLDKSKILGFITAGGSGSSHTAILARTMGIPAIVGMGDALKPEYEGRQAIADGATGALVIDPDDDTRDRLLKKRDEQLRLQRLLETLKGQANVTKDGKTIRIYCNIGSPEDVHAVQVNDGGGIGLFRSEFLYLNTSDYPTEDQQFEAYKQVLSDMDGKEVIIRTLDIGADKQIGYFNPAQGGQPRHGYARAAHLPDPAGDFQDPAARTVPCVGFRQAGHYVPMVTSVWEVREAKKLCEGSQA